MRDFVRESPKQEPDRSAMRRAARRQRKSTKPLDRHSPLMYDPDPPDLCSPYQAVYLDARSGLYNPGQEAS